MQIIFHLLFLPQCPHLGTNIILIDIDFIYDNQDVYIKRSVITCKSFLNSVKNYLGRYTKDSSKQNIYMLNILVTTSLYLIHLHQCVKLLCYVICISTCNVILNSNSLNVI